MNKVGPHVIRPTGEALDWARAAGVVKALDDTTALKVAGPLASVLVYRRYFPTQDITRHGGDVMAEVAAALGEGPATHVELFNETAQRLGQGLERHVEFTREAVRWLREHRPGWTLVAFCFSTGNPEREDWEYLRQHGYGGASVIGLHEYWGNQGFTPWHALRHRTVHEWTNGDHPPFLITECGRDRVEGGRGGYVADGVSEEAYIAELRAFDAELMRDPYVIGATVFTGGPTPDWRAFDTDPLSGRLAATAGPLPPPSQETPMAQLLGIDCSNWQEVIDWAAVAASGRAFAFVKASEDPTYRDPYFAANWAACKRVGMTRGCYHFARPDQATPEQSIALLAERLGSVGGLEPGDLVALDIEAGEGNLLDWVTDWCRLCAERLHVVPVIYSGHWFMEPHGLEDPSLGQYPLWYASYQAEAPPAPTGWDRLSFWQFTAHGQVPGVQGDADENVYYGSRDDLIALGKPASAEPPPYDVGAARDRLWAEANALEAAGWPWFGAGVKALVSLSKQEK